MPPSRNASLAPLPSIDPLNKGIGLFDQPLAHEEVASLGWNLLNEDICLPAAVLYEDKLRHNIDWMRRFIRAYGVNLAPHGKTTMAPRLFEMQIEAGAWGITVATAHHALVAYRHGVRRVLLANQLVGRQNMTLIAQLLRDPGFTFYCLVDSAEQIDPLGAFFAGQGLCLNVLFELGVTGGRSGLRNDEQMRSALEALARWSLSLALCGVELYEGVLSEEGAIRAFLQRAVETARTLAAEGRFRRSPFLLSGAGSAWYDVVAEVFAGADFGKDAEIVLRPGCYLTHDVGAYRLAQERILAANPVARQVGGNLVTALHIWAHVQSRPEPRRAIVGLGRRDAAFDSGLPVPALHYRPGQKEPLPPPAHWKLAKIMDQHAYLDLAADDDLHIGDMIAFDIAHPCLTFDKWRILPLLDSEYRVVDLIQTFF